MKNNVASVAIFAGVLLGLLTIRAGAQENVLACYSPASGTVRIVASHDECHTGGRLAEVPVSWASGLACTERVGHFSCPGIGFSPASSDTVFSFIGSVRLPDGGSDPWFSCPAVLPDGAVITRVRFRVRDYDEGAEVACKMWRTDLSTGNVFVHQVVVADAGGTGDTETPFETDLATDAIAFPVVDNANYAYYVQCLLGGTMTGLYGASVEYTLPCD